MLNGEQIKTIIYKICYYFIAGVLLFSGIAKIIDPIPLMEALNSTKLINEQISLIISVSLPFIEIVLGIMLISRKFVKTTIVTSTILFSTFLAFAVYGNLVDLNSDCGCFGTIAKSNFDFLMVGRNILFLNIVIQIFRWEIIMK